MPPLDEFKREVVAYLPGLLALFDIADAKRRNFHLGHRVVDRDIDELDRQVRSSVGASGLAKRVGGDEWLALYKSESVEPVAALLDTYYKEQEFLVGWKSTGEKDGQIKVAQRTVPSRLVRSLRCIYAFTNSSQDTSGLIDSLLEHHYGLPPNTPHALSGLATMKKSSWHCVSAYPPESPYCPFCESSDFD